MCCDTGHLFIALYRWIKEGWAIRSQTIRSPVALSSASTNNLCWSWRSAAPVALWKLNLPVFLLNVALRELKMWSQWSTWHQFEMKSNSSIGSQSGDVNEMFTISSWWITLVVFPQQKKINQLHVKQSGMFLKFQTSMKLPPYPLFFFFRQERMLQHKMWKQMLHWLYLKWKKICVYDVDLWKERERGEEGEDSVIVASFFF